jgi:uncharacterized protein (TIRG00374 family)
MLPDLKRFIPPSNVLNILKVCISIGLLYLVFKDIDIQFLASQIVSTSVTSLVLYLLISLLLLLLASYRWSLLLLEAPTRQQVLQFFKANVSALFYNLFLPTAYGGDLVKWTQLESKEFSKKSLIVSVVADRLLGLMGLITVGFIASVLATTFNLVPLPPIVWMLFTALFIGLVICLTVIFSPLQFSQLPFVSKISQLQQLDAYFSTKKMRFLQMYLLAIGIQIISFLSFYLLAVEAHVGISFIYFLTVSPVVSLISVLPISLAGFGTTEAAYLYFFGQLGATKDSILVFTSLFGLFKVLLGGIGWFTDLMVTSKRVSRGTVKK